LRVRRVGCNAVRASDAAAASGSTNLLDSGTAEERDLDGLIDEIAAFAAL
jgi:predicted amidohydrolase